MKGILSSKRDPKMDKASCETKAVMWDIKTGNYLEENVTFCIYNENQLFYHLANNSIALI